MAKAKITIQQLNKLIGRRVHFFRKLRGISQIELAAAAGYNSTGTISRIECGSAGIAKIKILAIAEKLSVNPIILTLEDDLTDEQFVMINNLITLMKNPSNKEDVSSIKSIIGKSIK